MAINSVKPYVLGMTCIYLDPVLQNGTIQDLNPITGQWSREIMKFTLTEYLNIPGSIYHSLECVRFQEGLCPKPERIIRTFHNPTTFAWAKRIFYADREYLKQQHMAIWDLMMQQQNLDISPPFCCLVAACS